MKMMNGGASTEFWDMQTSRMPTPQLDERARWNQPRFLELMVL